MHVLYRSSSFTQELTAGLTQWFDDSATPPPVLTEKNIQASEGEIRIHDGEPSRLSQNPDDTAVQ